MQSKRMVIKELAERTGLSVQRCKQALAVTEEKCNLALLWLRQQGDIEPVPREAIAKQYRLCAEELAIDFLITTRDTGELKAYHTAGEMRTIQENYYDLFATNIAILATREIGLLTDNEQRELEDLHLDAYTKSVEKNLHFYLT